ncbi:5362_t:CDS:10 [Funneliformis geosporum]|uniref:2830_t:CDS:1 n=1 Tax=Funneliformis geosporum TaxID=1117311 RepID=A0A9W4SB92_9GLOM|nr:2830_t:CDS:10 [Funneliformis geosporum]CAI2178982.1 5362_t:CDS:10 [Funneliformis geosporum]
MTIALHEILKKRIIDAIKSVQPPGGWKVVVVDEASLKIIESACKMFDILEEKVTSVENLEKSRQAYQSLDAVYIITPTYESISKVIEDFKSNKTPLYAHIHLFFVSNSALPRDYLIQRIDLFIDFHAKEAQVYSFESPSSFFKLYSPEENAGIDDELRILAKKLLSVCISLGENPLIRYQRSLDSDHPTKALPYKLAMLVQNEMDNFVRLNPGFPPQDSSRPRGVLFIVDRTIDMYSPILHEFTYQAMANDLLAIEDGKYNYNYTGEDGTQATKEAILDESDSIWVEIRHKHMKDCIDKLMKDFNEFLTDNQGFAEKDKAVNLNDMKKMLATLPQFQNMKEKFSVHLSIAQECMALFEKESLDKSATIEQNCATGHTADGAHPKTLVEDMVPLLDNPVMSSLNKTRMLMLYIMYKNGILEEDRRKLLEHARITLEENDAINNLLLFGVKLIRVRIKFMFRIVMSNKKYRQKPGEEIQYEISRYIPKLKLLLESHIKGNIDHTAYPYTKDPTGDPEGLKGTQQGPVSLRSARAGWYKKGQAVENRVGRIIVFVAGGVTYSELRSSYEVSAKLSRDVVIGSTHIITPNKFIDDLKLLYRPPTKNYVKSPMQAISTPPQLPPRPGSTTNTPPPFNRSNSPSGYFPQQTSYQTPQAGYPQQGFPPQVAYQQNAYSYPQPPQSGGYQPQGQYPLPPLPPPQQQYGQVQKPSSTSSTTSSKSKKLFGGFDKFLG